MSALKRRAFLRTAAFAAVATAAGCASSAATAGTSAGSDAALAKQSDPTGTGAWTEEWEELVAAARAEGKLSLLTLVGRGYESVVDSFQRAFPGIEVSRLAESSAKAWLGGVRLGRRAGRHEFDLAFVQADRALTEGVQAGLWAPLRPLLFRQDVLEDGLWMGGLAARFLDSSGTLCFSPEYQVFHAYAINTDMVRLGEITSIRDLLDPKWKGEILSLDPRLGTGLLSAASVARHWGDDVVKQLLVDQQPTFRSWGPDQVTDALVSGAHPIALGVRPKALDPLRAQGRGYNVQYLDLLDADFAAGTPMLYFDRAPHPAAAKLFANWVLTREVQTALTSGLMTNSARTDVEPFEPDGVGAAGKPYFEPDREANYEHIAQTQRLVGDLLSGQS